VPGILLAAGEVPLAGGWVWAGILLGLRFLRIPPIYDQRRWMHHAWCGRRTWLVMILCFMPVPLWGIGNFLIEVLSVADMMLRARLLFL